MKSDLWISAKGIRYILAPKRGAWNTINPDVCASLTAKGQANWIGSFISPDILEVQHTKIQGGTEPTKITMRSGNVYYFDGTDFTDEKGHRYEMLLG